MTSPHGLILLAGASGYVGGRLRRALEAGGERVRCLARDPARLRARVGPATEVVPGDVQERETLLPAMAGVATAYYLVHSMAAPGGWADRDRAAARTFAAAARDAGVGRIVYLGGLGDGDLSPHLRSRQEVGAVLRTAGVPVVEFRASIILGSGSLSFEMIRALVDRLPVMVTPRWVNTLAQPIAIEDVIRYLVAALDLDPGESSVLEIGGADRVSYRDLMRAYARARGLRRWFLPVPVLTPRLSSLWLGLVTPVFARVGRELIEGVRNETVVREPRALDRFALRPLGHRDAIARALANEDEAFAATRWSDALSSSPAPPGYGGARFGSRLVESHECRVAVPPSRAFAPVRRIGGQRGWYYGRWLWRLRGWIDLLAGGPGLRRGRRDPDHLLPGDALDCWRVEAIETDRLLRLRSEMRLPGRAWLQFEIEEAAGGSTIRQTAIFDPIGIGGLAYWYGIHPVHRIVFKGMLAAIARAATSAEG